MKSKHLYILFLLLFGQVFSTVAQYNQSLTNYTLLKNNPEDLIPVTDLSLHTFALIVPDQEKYHPLINTLNRYADISVYTWDSFQENKNSFSTLIAVFDDSDKEPFQALDDFRKLNAQSKKRIVLTFGAEWEDIRDEKSAVLWAANAHRTAQENMAMTVFGGLASTQGIKTEQTRIQYTFGKGSHFNVKKLEHKIDAIAEEAIQQKATPGMVIMVVKSGQVILEKAYGNHTYDGAVSTKTNDIFDLASISKIVGTTPVIMHLSEENKLNLNLNIGDYLPEARKTNKKDISLRTVLLHEAGFIPFIPFYKYLKPDDIVSKEDEKHQTQIEENVYLANDYYKNIMWPEMLQSKVNAPGKYVYSDISMYVMKEVAERITHQPMDEFVANFLYNRIGMKTAGYNPLERFAKERIVPTERDTAFRKTLIHGFVHDEGAALAGGTAGHAGLFSTANDLAIYAQMLLNRGKYGGIQYYEGETVDLYTSNQSLSSRRGLGFDRRDPNPEYEYPSKWANRSVFGHTGFTGTAIWIDPENQLTYIFLSNRVHPERSGKLFELNIRSRIQDAIYETINEVN